MLVNPMHPAPLLPTAEAVKAQAVGFLLRNCGLRPKPSLKSTLQLEPHGADAPRIHGKPVALQGSKGLGRG
jgi:hypothetical protein